MSDTPADPPPPEDESPRRRRLHTRAVERRGRWPGVVWAIPIAALLVVAYLGIQAVVSHGVDVVVTFKTAGGAQAGETPVVYKGVTVGHVVRIRIAQDARNVEMTLRLESRARSHLGQSAKFWLIGAEPRLTDLSSLKAAVSGVSIGVSPGDGPPARHFIGLDQPPAVPPDTPGTLYILEGAEVGSTRVGSALYYHGLPVGRVTRVEIADPQTLRLVGFVNAPFDRLVKPDTLFYAANAADLSLSAGHISASIGPGASVITGGIEFDTPTKAAGETQSRAHAVFHFYPNRAEAADQPRGPEVRYRAVFQAASQRLDPEAPVWLGGSRVGRVIDAQVVLKSGATAPETQVTLELEPARLGLTAGADARTTTDAALRDLLRGGYRLQLGQYPPLIGTGNLVFQRDAAATRAALSGGDEPLIPTTRSAGTQELTAKVNAILDKVNGVPIQAIGEDVRAITGRLRTLVSSPQLTDSLQHLDGALTQVDQIATEVKPQVGPLVTKLTATADQLDGVAAAAKVVLSGEGAAQDSSLPDAIRQLDEAARSVRSLADYLGRHPEAVLKGKAKSAEGP